VAALYDSLLGRPLRGHAWPGKALLRDATSIQVDGPDRVLGRVSRFGVGFQLTMPGRPLGPNDGSFGHYGYGGALGFADPEAGVAFGYLMNRPGDRWQTPRTQRLVDAVYASLG
jgi:CubicO group peptidase (beta-lactamase class C family)